MLLGLKESNSTLVIPSFQTAGLTMSGAQENYFTREINPTIEGVFHRLLLSAHRFYGINARKFP